MFDHDARYHTDHAAVWAPLARRLLRHPNTSQRMLSAAHSIVMGGDDVMSRNAMECIVGHLALAREMGN